MTYLFGNLYVFFIHHDNNNQNSPIFLNYIFFIKSVTDRVVFNGNHFLFFYTTFVSFAVHVFDIFVLIYVLYTNDFIDGAQTKTTNYFFKSSPYTVLLEEMKVTVVYFIWVDKCKNTEFCYSQWSNYQKRSQFSVKGGTLTYTSSTLD